MTEQLAMNETATPAITDADMAAIRYWTALEPDPVFRCLHCDWTLPVNDPTDRTSSAWFRMEEHARETRHTVGIWCDRDDDAPYKVVQP